ncbi:MAG: hypothetical protein ACW97Z_16690 [Candidatus Hodarchaeales archaeon]
MVFDWDQALIEVSQALDEPSTTSSTTSEETTDNTTNYPFVPLFAFLFIIIQIRKKKSS